MFFRTQLKSIGTGGAVDMQGRRLAFIGYLPCKAGDWVFTDGSVIFGNAKPKGAPAIFSELSGIPVLGDFDSSGEKELRGYVTPRGRFKKYSVAGNDWIVNNDKNFAHDKSAEIIIDANISEKNELITVTDAFFQESHTLDLVHVLLQLKDSRYWSFDPYNYIPIHTLAREYTLGVKNLIDEDIYADFLVDGNKTKELSLKKYAKDAEKRALTCADAIMKLSFVGEDIYPYKSYEGETLRKYQHMTEYIYYTVSYRPQQPFIAHSIAYILASNATANGFGGVVFASAYGYCFPYIKSRLKKGNNFLREWKCVPFGVSCLYEITENNDLEPFAFRDFGGVDCDISLFVDSGWLCDTVSGPATGSVSILRTSRHLELKSGFEAQEWEKLIPVGKGFYRLNKFGLLSFFNSKQELVAEDIPVHDDFLYLEMDSSFFQPESMEFYLYDKPNMQCKEYLPDGTVETRLLGDVGDYTVQVIKDDEGHVIGYETERYQVASELPILDGYYLIVDGDALKPLLFTPLFYELKGGSYLYGVKGGKLFLKRGNDVELVGDGLKNFRLEELKKISKAKK